MTTIQFIGSGSWQGVPAPFGDDQISKSVAWDTKNFRFRTALHVTTNSGKSILVEATPDIRLQSWKFGLGKPDAILISHWHWDHLFGLLDLDWFAEKNQLHVYGNKVTKIWFDRSMAHINAQFDVFTDHDEIAIDNIKITALPVNHVQDTHGFLIENTVTGKTFFYASDFSSIPEATIAKVNKSDYATIDATYLDSEIDDDPTHVQRNEFATLMKQISGPELILANIGSYQNMDHDDFIAAHPTATIAYDGMKVTL